MQTLGRPLSSPFKSSEPTPQPISQTYLLFLSLPHVSLALLLPHVYTYIILILATFHLPRFLYQCPLQSGATSLFLLGIDKITRNNLHLQFSTTLPDLGLDPIVDELPAAPKPENGLLPPPSSDEAEAVAEEAEAEEVKEEEERRVFPPEKEADGAARVLQKLICDGEGTFSRF